MTKYLISTAAALFLIAAPLAHAQQNQGGHPGGSEHGSGQHGGGQHAGSQHGGHPPSGGTARPAGRPGGNTGGQHGHTGARPATGRPVENRPGNNGLRPGTGRPPGMVGPGDHRPGNNGLRPGTGRPPGMVGPGDHRPGNNHRPGGRPNYSQYHRTFRASRRFHAGVYRRPSGWYYRRWSYGDTLPRLFWGRDYWLLNFSAYGLMAPPPGTVWVRYGSDAILIDQYSGEVIQVAYGVFY